MNSEVWLEDRVRSHMTALRSATVPPQDLQVRILAAIENAASGAQARRPAAARRVSWWRRPRLRPAFPMAGILAMLLAVNYAGAYAFPNYGAALAAAPVIGSGASSLLRAAGLANTGTTPINDVAVSSGHTITLVAGYADSVRTVLFVRSDLAGAQIGPYATLTDQFGHTYKWQGGGGAAVLTFEPLAGPASVVGARLTLHVSRLIDIASPAENRPPVIREIAGSWDLHANLVAQQGRDLSLPAPLQVGDTVYTFVGVHVTASVIDIKWAVTGGLITRINLAGETCHPQLPAGAQPPAQPPSTKQPGSFGFAVPIPYTPSPACQQLHQQILQATTTRLLDPHGREIEPVSAGGSMRAGATAEAFEAVYPRPGAGTYHFRVGSTTDLRNVREIIVP